MTVKLAFSILLLAAASARAQQKDSDFEQMDREARQQDQDQADGKIAEDNRAQMEELSASMKEDYDRYVKSLAEQRENFRRLVLKQWSDYKESTVEQWVDYSKGGESRTTVDYDKGEIKIETLVPVEQKAQVKKIAENQIAAQAKKVVPEVKDQLKAPGVGVVTEKNADAFVKKDVAPKIVIDPKPIVAEDGKPRLKATVVIALVPDHLKIRAEAVKARVDEVSRKYDLDPALVFAIVHTESEFNPHARSAAPAFGLMQLMPKTAAREAYKTLYKEDKLVSPDYLYDPDNNLLLGATYLHLLGSIQFGKVKNADNRRDLMIAAYNCGPGCVRKTILGGRDADVMTNPELLALIQRRAPQETKDYVPRVEKRIGLYRGL